MMKSGAPRDKFGVLYRIVTYRIPWFTSRINSKGDHSLVPSLISNFLETLWVPLKTTQFFIKLFKIKAQFAPMVKVTGKFKIVQKLSHTYI